MTAARRRLALVLGAVVALVAAGCGVGAGDDRVDRAAARSVEVGGVDVTLSVETDAGRQRRVCTGAGGAGRWCLGPFAAAPRLEVRADRVGDRVLVTAVSSLDVRTVEGLDVTEVDLGADVGGQGLLAVAPDTGRPVCFTVVTAARERIHAQVAVTGAPASPPCWPD